MDFSQSEEQTATKELAAKILGDQSTHESLRAMEKQALTDGSAPVDRALWKALADSGLIGIGSAEANGGAGLGLMEVANVITEVGRTAARVPAWPTMGLGLPAIERFGTAEVIAKWVVPAVAGDAVLTAAWHEDSATGQMTTRFESIGDAWTITGRQICVPAGAIADAVVVVGYSADDGPVLGLVETAAATVIPLHTTNSSPDAELVFDHAPVTLLATGQAAIDWAYERAVATQCALALGVCEAMLALIASYTIERKQFDTQIARFQAVGHRAADCYIDTEGLRLTMLQAVSRLSDGLPATAEVSVAKFWAANALHRIALAAAHLHGGVGVDRDYPLGRLFLAAKEIELQLGGATQHLMRVGDVIAAEA